jgi:uncharacterized membrane protein YbhN (UPF0104 family)
MQQLLHHFKSYLRWVIIGGTLFFLAQALKENWQEVTTTQLQPGGGWFLAAALVTTLLAHCWAGWVWGWILQDLRQPVKTLWAIRIYLKTNVAKYLPGNIWHYYGRIAAARAVDISYGAATLSVLLESLLMAASALLLSFDGGLQLYPEMGGVIQMAPILSGIVLGVVLMTIHPAILSPLLGMAERLKAKAMKLAIAEPGAIHIQRYPLKPLLGEVLFLGLRATGFVSIMMAFHPLHIHQLMPIYTTFSLAWFLGLVVPGAPGGIGVFEAVAIALLKGSFVPGVVLSTVALYRVISILAESLGAGLVYLYEQQAHASEKKM